MTISENVMDNCKCSMPEGYPWVQPVPPVPFPVVPSVYPYPPFPIVPPIPPAPEPEPSTSVSQQICKLSRKASIITKMIENLDEKKKDVIISVGGPSYNFGNIDLTIDGWTDGSYAATVKRMLEFELGLIKAKIAELANEIGEDVDLSGIETTVGG